MHYVTDTHQHDFAAIEAKEKDLSHMRRAQAAAAVAAVRRATMPDIAKAFALVALGLGGATCLILIGVSFLNPALHMPPPIAPIARTSEATASGPAGQALPSPTAKPVPPVEVRTDMSEFQHVPVDDMIVTTGSEYPRAIKGVLPIAQWCYVNKTPLAYEIGRNGIPVPFDPVLANRAGLSQEDVQKALPACRWFSVTKK